MYYCSLLHLATCFVPYPAIIRPTRSGNVKVHSTSLSTGIPLFTLKDCKLFQYLNLHFLYWSFKVNNGIPLKKLVNVPFAGIISFKFQHTLYIKCEYYRNQTS